MANALYSLWKNGLMTAGANVSLDQNTVQDGPYLSLQDTATHPFSDTDQFYNAVESFVVGTTQRLTSPTVGTVAAGVFDAADVTFTAVSGATAETLIVYRHNSGASSTWRLVAFIDGVTGLPVTPNGGDIIITFNASGIFKL